MTDIYIVTEYFGNKRQNWDSSPPNLINEERRSLIVNQNWSLLKVYAFKDGESAKILASRINEVNDSDYHCVKIDKKQMFPTEESLIDKHHVYAVMGYNEMLFNGDIDFFQDEINAEIHKGALAKVNHEFYKMVRIPLSRELRLNLNGNFTADPLYLDVWGQEGKKYKFGM